METRANYLLVGSFVLVLTAGLLIFVIWLAKTQLDVAVARYDIRFTGSVTGLKVGSPVAFRGVRVGEVSDIVIDPETLDVVVTVAVRSDTPVKSDTVATLSAEGLAGGTFILLKGGSREAPPLKARAARERPVIQSEPSTLTQLLEGAPEVLAQARLTLNRVNELLNEENRAAIQQILNDIATLSGTLAERSGSMAKTLDNAEAFSERLLALSESMGESADRLTGEAEETLRAYRATAETLDESIAGAGEQAEQTLGEIQEASKSLQRMAGEIQGMIKENRPAIQEFTSGGLFELVRVLTELRDLVAGLNRITREVERDPGRFLFGDPQEGYEVPK